MTDGISTYVAGLLISCFICVFGGVYFGAKAAESKMQAQAIEANAAHYDSKTGEFVWGGR
jgi:hypothetical protein